MTTSKTKTAPEGARSDTGRPHSTALEMALAKTQAERAPLIPATSDGPAAHRDILTLCDVAGRADLGMPLIRAKATLQAVRARLAAEGATVPAPAASEPAVDAQPEPVKAVDTRAVYAGMRAQAEERRAALLAPRPREVGPRSSQRPLRTKAGGIDVGAIHDHHNRRAPSA